MKSKNNFPKPSLFLLQALLHFPANFGSHLWNDFAIEIPSLAGGDWLKYTMKRTAIFIHYHLSFAWPAPALSEQLFVPSFISVTLETHSPRNIDHQVYQQTIEGVQRNSGQMMQQIDGPLIRCLIFIKLWNSSWTPVRSDIGLSDNPSTLCLFSCQLNDFFNQLSAFLASPFKSRW
jgi:hypothetical protein